MTAQREDLDLLYHDAKVLASYPDFRGVKAEIDDKVLQINVIRVAMGREAWGGPRLFPRFGRSDRTPKTNRAGR